MILEKYPSNFTTVSYVITIFDFSYFWASALRFHATTSISLHGITLYLCVVMAFIRWKAMRTVQNIFMKNPKIVWYLFGTITVTVTAMCVPTYLVHEVKLIRYKQQNGIYMELMEYYTVDISQYALENKCEVFKANLWIIGIFLKVIWDLKMVNRIILGNPLFSSPLVHFGLDVQTP